MRPNAPHRPALLGTALALAIGTVVSPAGAASIVSSVAESEVATWATGTSTGSEPLVHAARPRTVVVTASRCRIVIGGFPRPPA